MLRFWGPYAIGLGLIVLGAGCLSGPAVSVEVCGDVAVPTEVDTLRLSLSDENGVESYSGVFDLYEFPADGGCPLDPEALPQSFDLREGAGRMWVTVQGLRDQIEVTRVEARIEFPVRGSTDVTVALTSDCLGVSCAFGQTCVAGLCEIAQFGGTPNVCETLQPRDPTTLPDGGSACGTDGGP
ncbi:MAG: hypothetical protein P1V51_03190 [Deltaproteobacteria bacterium]|nr:hypothetical protein [Deltaproteobacteria bacterium]